MQLNRILRCGWQRTARLGWLLTVRFGHHDMYWHRLLERLGRSSLVGTTVREGACLPRHLAGDEHHEDWADAKGCVATSVGGGCVLGAALTKAADEVMRVLAVSTCRDFHLSVSSFPII